MNKLYHLLRKMYTKTFGMPTNTSYAIIKDGNKVNNIIYEQLSDPAPCMIARYGATELSCILNYLSIIEGKQGHKMSFIKGSTSFWWWNTNIMQQMRQWSGFFPPTEKELSQFAELMIQDSREVDILAVFSSVYHGVNRMLKFLPNCQSFFMLPYIDPFLYENPWSRALEGKRVVVVHPFAELIESQYSKREFLFDNPLVLPEFELRTVKAVQSIGGESNGFRDWFEALEWMKQEIDKEDYDICLIGCGAYGFPLAAHVKRAGRQAIHVGGSLQLWFGIKGKRWENPSSLDYPDIPNDFYLKLMSNKSWVRPDEYVTQHSKSVENGCYW